MTPKTAQNIVNKMVCGGYTISLRKTKNNTISQKTWDAITNMLFSYYDCKSVSIEYSSKSSAKISANTINNEQLFSCNVTLF